MPYRLPWYRVSLVREGSCVSEHNAISSPEEVFAVTHSDFAETTVEKALMLALDTKNKIIGVFTISTGSLNASIIHPRDLFQRAILCNAASVILVHNHPSGDPTPSAEDLELTRKMVKAGKLMDIPVLDHVIIGEDRYSSLKEKELM